MDMYKDPCTHTQCIKPAAKAAAPKAKKAAVKKPTGICQSLDEY